MKKKSIEEKIKSLLFVTHRKNNVMVRGKEMYLYDHKGKKYLDFIGGWAVNALGHSPKVISNTLKKQSKKLLNASPIFYNEPMLKFAKEITQVSGLERVFFCSTGAEANESAIKLARKFGALKKNGAYEIITMEKSFHGRTLATMSACGKEAFKELFEPKVKGFKHVKFNDIEAVKNALNPNTCAIMLEPVQGEGGVNVADIDYIKNLRKLCDETNTLLIFDEIQTGFGRCGTLFAYEYFGILPDIVSLGKGIGGGFPLAAMLAKEELNLFEAGEQGGTYTAQPLGMAVGRAVLKKLIKDKIPSHAKKMGEYIKLKLKSLMKDYPIQNIRGLGLLIAFEIKNIDSKELVEKAFDNALILNSPQPSIIRLMPPLNLKKKHIELMISRLTRSIKTVLKK